MEDVIDYVTINVTKKLLVGATTENARIVSQIIIGFVAICAYFMLNSSLGMIFRLVNSSLESKGRSKNKVNEPVLQKTG